MSGIDCLKLLNLTEDREKIQERYFTEFIDNFKHFWSKEFNDFYRNRLIKKKKEENNCKKIKNRIESLKEQIKEGKSNINSYENKIVKLETQMINIDKELEKKLSEKQALEDEKEKLKKKLNKYKKFDEILKEKQLFYDRYAGCNLIFEHPDVYKLSFPCMKAGGNFIKFKKCEYTNNFTIVDVEPKKSLSETIIQKFHETQDTQGLLCVFRQFLSQY